LDFNSEEKYQKLKKWHFETYEKLARHYLEKKDASDFLNQYLEYFEKIYVPKNKKLEKWLISFTKISRIWEYN